MPAGLQFVLILPDGSKSLVPADWTDFKTASGTPQAPLLAGSLDDLLRLRRLTDALLRRPADLPVRSPIPETCLWEQLDDQQKRIVIETLARLLVQATSDKQQEQTND